MELRGWGAGVLLIQKAGWAVRVSGLGPRSLLMWGLVGVAPSECLIRCKLPPLNLCLLILTFEAIPIMRITQ